jgi:lipopolysaccharide/colanic/teichoic acid biosynthesis glycosyltransferase
MPEPLTVVMVGAGGGSLLMEFARRQFRIFKEVMDFVGGGLLLLAFAPVMLLCAFLIKVSDPKGPVLYCQVRVGLNGRLFTIRWMRRSHVDELPQLWNIFRGEMSLVGPRPERPEMFQKLCQQVPEFEQRLTVKPGLTGLAQIKNGYDTDIDSVRRKLEYDLEYIRNMSLSQEIRLLLATFAKFNDQGAR